MNYTRRFSPGRARWVATTVLAVLLTLAALPVMGEEPAPWPALRDQDEESKAILMKMADYIAGLPVFAVEYRSGYDAIQEDGQRIEFGSRRRVLLKRPDMMRVETENSDGDKGLVVFNGKDINVFKYEDNVYARVEKAGTVDQVLVYLVRDLHFTLPMARMLLTAFPAQMDKRLSVAEVGYVEENTLFDVPTDHLAVRMEGVDMQLWIAQGDQPLPRRIILTYTNAPGEPQYRADFLKWDLSPEIGDDTFTFTPPADAEQIPLLAPIRQMGSIPGPQGGQ